MRTEYNPYVFVACEKEQNKHKLALASKLIKHFETKAIFYFLRRVFCF